MKFNIIDPRINRPSFFSNKPAVNTKFTKRSDIYTYLRGAKIPPFLLNKRVAVHNGRFFLSFKVKPFMIGFKFGVFSRTKKLGPKIHEKKKKKTKTKKK